MSERTKQKSYKKRTKKRATNGSTGDIGEESEGEFFGSANI